MTTSAGSASRSVTFPFPSSPHRGPTIASPGIGSESRRGASLRRRRDSQVAAHDRDGRAGDLLEPRDRADADLLAQLIEAEVARDDDRALVLPALVDDRVELLEHPL